MELIFINIIEKFNLDATQKDISFVNISTQRDTLLFIEPYKVQYSQLFVEAKQAFYKIESFFEYVFELYYYGEKDTALDLLLYSRESNELGLGYSTKRNRGKGVSKDALDKVFSTICENVHVSKDILSNISTLVLFVPNFSQDRMSDLLASIIKKELYEYTMKQAAYHKIPIDYNVHDYGYYWDADTLSWEQLTGYSIKDDDNKAILFTPKDIVVKEYRYSAVELMYKVIFPVLKEEHLQMPSSPIVHKETNKDGEIVLIGPSQKELYNYEVKSKYDYNKVKSFVLVHTLKEPEYYFEYVSRISSERRVTNLTDEELEDLV